MSNTRILFSGYDTDDSDGLWVTDGTGAGTTELMPADASADGLSPAYLVTYGNQVLFSGDAKNGTFGLWTTDGTSQGTTQIMVAGAGSEGLLPAQLTLFNGMVFFAGSDTSGRGLWMTDGTAGGTSELTPTGAASYGVNPEDLTVVTVAAGTRLAFNGADAAGDNGLWLSDGMSGGTIEIYQGSADTQGVSPFEITPISATQFVFAGLDGNGFENLFVSDGTTGGTQELTGIANAPTDSDFVSSLGSGMAVLNGKALFAAYDATANTVDLWSTDGTVGGTQQVSVTGADASGLQPSDLTTLGNLVLFNGLDASGNAGLWKTDGLTATELTGIAGAAQDFQPSNLTAIGNELYFNALDSAGQLGLWESDGTVGGTQEIVPTQGASSSGLDPSSFAALVPCYAAGTRLRTARGDVAVERLRVGDMMVTVADGASPVVWIGRRTIDCTRHPDPDAVRPVRIAAGAFGGGLPLRDLILSPDHAVFIDGALIPVRYLVNGGSIAPLKLLAVTYYHVELPRHGVLLAEGLPAESYLETGQRGTFAGVGQVRPVRPGAVAICRDAGACAPYVVAGPALQAVRDRLSASMWAAAA